MFCDIDETIFTKITWPQLASSSQEIGCQSASSATSYERLPGVKYRLQQSRHDVFPACLDQEFDTIEYAEHALRIYSKDIGFKLRLSNVERDKSGDIKLRRFVCACQGQRKRKRDDEGDIKSIRCGCPFFAVYKLVPSHAIPNKMVFRINSMDAFHNHELMNIVQPESYDAEYLSDGSQIASRQSEQLFLARQSLPLLIGNIRNLAQCGEANRQYIRSKLLDILKNRSLVRGNDLRYPHTAFKQHDQYDSDSDDSVDSFDMLLNKWINNR